MFFYLCFLYHIQSENVEKESSASESSLESSSGYGSQSGMSGATPTPEFDNGHSEGEYKNKKKISSCSIPTVYV